MGHYYQQGDVLMFPTEIPMGAKKDIETGILAVGEVTGHAHRIKNKKTAILFLIGTTMYLRALQKTEIIHEEHDLIPLPQGDYRIDFVREYDHFREEARRATD
jgi:hypothetical protein